MASRDHIDEAAPVKHAGRSDRIEPEHHEADHIGEQQHDAQRAVLAWMPPPQPTHQRERDDEVGVVVEVGEHRAKEMVAPEPVVERYFRIDVEQPLEAEDAAAVGEGGVQPEG
jgi:hypothetical protein